MKKIVSGEELKNKMLDGINLLCDTVKQTLGPRGNNVIIDHSNFSPFITNDGVTIAENIESDDPVLSSILEIAKEASIKTNDNVGDGTTTTLVLLQSLINLGQKCINDGVSPIAMKKALSGELENILNKLEKLKLNSDKFLRKNVAIISANDFALGNLVNEVVDKIESKLAISIKEDFGNDIVVKYINGYACSISHPSEYYFQEHKSLNYRDAYILIVNDFLGDINSISTFLNAAITEKKAFIIIAKDFDQYLVNEIISLNLEDKVSCLLLRISEYGLRERIVQKDIEVITKSKIAESSFNITGENIGIAKSVYVDRELFRVEFSLDDTINDYVSKIESNSFTENSFDLEFNEKRKAMFNNGIAEITVGAPTKVERQEKRMRLEDAICAAYASKNGYLLGGGVSLLNVAREIDCESDAGKIWNQTLVKPFEQILTNSGADVEAIEEIIKNKQYKVVYNVYNDSYEYVDNTVVVDAYDVVVNSLVNACSIAGMLLTTNSLIINERQNNLDKVSEYTEL